VPVFTVMIVGFMTKKVSETAATTGLIFFIVTYMLSQLVLDLPLHYLHVLGILFIATVALMLIVARWKPMAVPYVQPNTAVVDLKPWRSRHLFFLLLLVLMAGAFILFSEAGIAQ
jgi:SSS family solute:Na+ symporter